MKNLIESEPTLLIGLLKAALIAAVAFGLPLSGDQTAALIAVATAGLALTGVNRAVVTPVARPVGGVVDTAADEAKEILDRLDPDKGGE